MSSVTGDALPLVQPAQEQPIADAINSVKQAVSFVWTAAQPVISQMGQKAQAAYTEGKGYVTRNFSIHANGFFASSTTTIYYIAVTALSIKASYALSVASAFCNILPVVLQVVGENEQGQPIVVDGNPIRSKIHQLHIKCNQFFYITSTKIRDNFPIRIQGALYANIEAAARGDSLTNAVVWIERHVTAGANWCNSKINTVMFRLTENADFAPRVVA